MELKDKKILVTGGNGFLGAKVVDRLVLHGVSHENIFAPRSSERDLRKWDDCVKAVAGQEVVIHLAAVVGGITCSVAACLGDTGVGIAGAAPSACGMAGAEGEGAAEAIG